MSGEESSSDDGPSSPTTGRTWADLVWTSSYFLGGLLFIAGVMVVAYFTLGKIPSWLWISIGASLAFIPFLIERAKDDSSLYVVVDGPCRMTEYRIGRRVPLTIDGQGVRYSSSSGVDRLILTSFNPEERTGASTAMAGMTQFDMMRDLSTLDRLSEALVKSLREDRLTMQHVGVEVERRSRDIVDWALQLIYHGTVPHEITDALGVDPGTDPDLDHHETMEAVLDDV